MKIFRKSAIERGFAGEECVICGESFVGFGNNPAPIKEEGQCCETCNDTVVVPFRLLRFAVNDLVERKESDDES
jgi:hypothetical protein